MTSQDLKQIGDLLDKKLDEKLDQKFDEKLKGVKSDITGMKSDITGMKSDITGMKSDITGMKSDIAVLKDTTDRTEKHLQSIEDHLIEWKSDLFDIVDGLAGETRDNREFRDIGSHQIKSNTTRIEKLETKVFGSATTV